jgi:hypothetical protein
MQSEVERVRLQPNEELGASHRCQFRVGGVSVEVVGRSSDDISLSPALELFRNQAPLSDIDLEVEWTEQLHTMAGQQLFDSGSAWRLYEDGSQFLFDFSTSVLGDQPYKRLLVDRHFRRATLQMSEACFAGSTSSVTALEYPLDELLIMHRLTQEKAIELHGAGIVTSDGIGNLFVGHSGAGKSTTTRLWTALEDVEVLSDDRIIVRRDEDRAEKQVPRYARNDKAKGKMRMYGTPWHGEAMYASPNSAPLARILILEHGYGNVLTPLSPSQAVAELFARSFVPFHRHEYVESALTFLQEVVEAVPVYRYAFEPDQRAVDAILNLRD